MSEKTKQMRQLDDAERKITETNLKRNKEELQGLVFAKHQAELMLAEGIDAEYNMNKKKYVKQLSGVEQGIETIKFAIEVVEKQLKEGVEIKDVPELDEIQLVVTIPNKQYDVLLDKVGEIEGCIVKKKEEGDE